MVFLFALECCLTLACFGLVIYSVNDLKSTKFWRIAGTIVTVYCFFLLLGITLITLVEMVLIV